VANGVGKPVHSKEPINLAAFPYLDSETKHEDEATQNQPESEAEQFTRLLHHIFGHVGMSTLKRTLKAWRPDLVGKLHKFKWCEACRMAKSTRKSLNSLRPMRSLEPGEVMHTDLSGPFSPTADPNRAAYLQIIADDWSKYLQVNLLKAKSEAAEQLIFHIKHFKNVTGRWIRSVYHDLGGESNTNELDKFMRSIGAEFHTSPQGIHERNPVAEALLRRIQDMTRVLLQQGCLPKRCWGYAAMHAVNIMNMVVKDPATGITPYERFYDRAPLWHMLKPFGCRAVVHINKERQERGKLGARGQVGRYAGFNPVNNTHLVLLDGKDGSVGRHAIEAVHVDFDEEGIIKWAPQSVEEREPHHEQTTSTSSQADEFVRDVLNSGPVTWITSPESVNVKPGWQLQDTEQASGLDARLKTGTSHGNGNGDGKSEASGAVCNETGDGTSGAVCNETGEEKSETSGAVCCEPGHAGGGAVCNDTSADESGEAHVSMALDDEKDPLNEVNPSRFMEDGGAVKMSVDSGGGQQADLSDSGGGNPQARSDSEDTKADEKTTSADESLPRRSARGRQENTRYAQDFYAVSLLTIGEVKSLDDHDQDEPDVRKVYHLPEWKAAINEELKSLEAAGTFELVNANDLTEQERKSAIESTLKLKRKRNEYGKVVRHKARLCARGDQYDHAEIFGETFSPTPQLSTIRLVLYVMAALSLATFQLDIKSAFVQARLLESVFLIPCKEAGLPPGTILKCWKSLYGLPQAGANWYHLLRDTLISAGLTESLHDRCLFYLKQAGTILLVLFHVDDLLLVGPTYLIKKIVGKIQSRFPTTGSQHINHFCGMAVRDHGDTVSISATAYIDSCLERFGLQSEPFVRVPIIERLLPEDSEPRAPVRRYQELIGSILWIARLCRPDVSFACHELCLHTSNPSVRHMKAAQRVFQYLRTTKHHGLVIPKRAALDLMVHCDADFHRVGARKPTSGIIVSMGKIPVDWKSKTQTHVACSTYESELAAAFEATREAVAWKMFLQELQLCHGGPVDIREDNQAVTYFAGHTDTDEKMKHLPVKYHYIKEQQREGQIRLVPISSKLNIADVMTKPLPSSQFELLRDGLCVRSCGT
jgi:hypothetical protein